MQTFKRYYLILYQNVLSSLLSLSLSEYIRNQKYEYMRTLKQPTWIEPLFSFVDSFPAISGSILQLILIQFEVGDLLHRAYIYFIIIAIKILIYISEFTVCTGLRILENVYSDRTTTIKIQNYFINLFLCQFLPHGTCCNYYSPFTCLVEFKFKKKCFK